MWSFQPPFLILSRPLFLQIPPAAFTSSAVTLTDQSSIGTVHLPNPNAFATVPLLLVIAVACPIHNLPQCSPSFTGTSTKHLPRFLMTRQPFTPL